MRCDAPRGRCQAQTAGGPVLRQAGIGGRRSSPGAREGGRIAVVGTNAERAGPASGAGAARSATAAQPQSMAQRPPSQQSPTGLAPSAWCIAVRAPTPVAECLSCRMSRCRADCGCRCASSPCFIVADVACADAEAPRAAMPAAAGTPDMSIMAASWQGAARVAVLASRQAQHSVRRAAVLANKRMAAVCCMTGTVDAARRGGKRSACTTPWVPMALGWSAAHGRAEIFHCFDSSGETQAQTHAPPYGPTETGSGVGPFGMNTRPGVRRMKDNDVLSS